MEGFFEKKETHSNNISESPQSCASCGLYKNCESPKMKPFGEFKKEVLFLGNSPTELDDIRGKQFQGKEGRYLQNTLRNLDFDLFQDGLCYNICNCYSSREKPNANQATCCRSKVLQVINEYKPKVVILLGSLPITGIIGNLWKKGLGGVEKWRGWNIPDRELNAWICPTYSPGFVQVKEDHQGTISKLFFKEDLKKALGYIDQRLPIDNEEKKIVYIRTTKDLKRIIPELINTDLLSFDYETTGLKPHAEGHKIISVSACPNEDIVYVWLNDKIKQRLFKKVLKSKVPKTAHNFSYEETWSKEIIGTNVNNWKWCSMNNAHILDNRPGITGLKFQTYVNFGVADYDSNINPYLISDPKLGANAFNSIQKLLTEGKGDELLKYNALDSLFGYKLTKRQMELI